MGKKANNESERLGRILDRIADDIATAPGSELLDDARQDGRDPVQTAAKVKGLLRRALKNHQRGLMKKSQEGYEREVAAIRSRPIELPQTPQRRRELLSAVFSRKPQLQAAFTFQNRGFSELTDEDVENHLRKLALLGILDEVKPPEENE